MNFKKYIQYIDYYCPSFLKRPIKKYFERQKINQIKERFQRIKISKEEITDIVNNLTLDSDVFLHSSIT